MESSNGELNDISAELKQLSLRRHQLLEKKKFKNLIDELKSRNGFKQPEETSTNQQEVDSIDDKVKQLAEKKAKLQKCPDNDLDAKGKNNESKVIFHCNQTVGPTFPAPPPPPALPAPTMKSSDCEIKNIPNEMKQLSLKRKQLLEKRKLQCMCQEFRKNGGFGHTDEAALNQHEIDKIDDKLKELAEKKAELQKCYKNNLNANDKNESKVTFTPEQKVEHAVPVSPLNIVYVEAPPNIPAPTVILDLKNLPAQPSRTQCPECQQFVITETFTSASSLTWLVCFMTALTGCVAGCCFIPFCMDRFKTTIHKCPKCRTSIQAVKKL